MWIATAVGKVDDYLTAIEPSPVEVEHSLEHSIEGIYCHCSTRSPTSENR